MLASLPLAPGVSMSEYSTRSSMVAPGRVATRYGSAIGGLPGNTSTASGFDEPHPMSAARVSARQWADIE